jgi:ribosomal protein S18 acetylase RimI-like enzyme
MNLLVYSVEKLDSLIIVDKKGIRAAANVLTRAFQDDPLTELFFPDLETRMDLIPFFYEYRLKMAMMQGVIYTTSQNMEGVATWLPSKRGKVSMLQMMRSGGFKLYRKVGNETINTMNAVSDFVTQRRLKNAGDKYLHLEMLAVEPKHQKQGYAKKLLAPMFEKLDSERLPCYLETTSERNIPFYQYFDFEIVDEGEFPGSDVIFWDMIRSPQ